MNGTSAPCTCQPCPSHFSGFSGLLDDQGIMGGVTIDRLASLALVVIVGLQIYDRFWGKHAR